MSDDDHLPIRRITIEESRTLRREVLRAHQSADASADQEPPNAVLYGAFDPDDGELLATGSIMPDGEPGDWRIRGMATRSGARGHGLGSAVLAALIEHAAAAGARRVWCNARVAAVPVYERAGLAVVSDPFELPEIGEHVRMEAEIVRAAG